MDRNADVTFIPKLIDNTNSCFYFCLIEFYWFARASGNIYIVHQPYTHYILRTDARNNRLNGKQVNLFIHSCCYTYKNEGRLEKTARFYRTTGWSFICECRACRDRADHVLTLNLAFGGIRIIVWCYACNKHIVRCGILDHA